MQPKPKPTKPHLTAYSKPKTAGELYAALDEIGFFGLWKDRTDITDSCEYARQLRSEVEIRPNQA